MHAADRTRALSVAVRRALLLKRFSPRTSREDRANCRVILQDSEKLDQLVAEVGGHYADELAAATADVGAFPDGVIALLNWIVEHWDNIAKIIAFVISLFADATS